MWRCGVFFGFDSCDLEMLAQCTFKVDPRFMQFGQVTIKVTAADCDQGIRCKQRSCLSPSNQAREVRIDGGRRAKPFGTRAQSRINIRRLEELQNHSCSLAKTYLLRFNPKNKQNSREIVALAATLIQNVYNWTHHERRHSIAHRWKGRNSILRKQPRCTIRHSKVYRTTQQIDS